MKATDLLTKSEDELKELIIQCKREILNLKFQRVNGQLTNPARFRSVRRDIARIKTVLNQRKAKTR
jgi:large subunit ribosomal protein L29